MNHTHGTNIVQNVRMNDQHLRDFSNQKKLECSTLNALYCKNNTNNKQTNERKKI